MGNGVTFRPSPGMTIACAILFAILCGLGVWQLERLQWKLALIATVNGHMTAAPVTLDAISAMTADEGQYRRVTLHGHFDHGREAYVFTTDASGAPVYHVLTPFLTGSGKTLMVDRGAVPQEGGFPPPPAGRQCRRRDQRHRGVARARCARPVHARGRSGASHLVRPRSRRHRRGRSHHP